MKYNKHIYLGILIPAFLFFLNYDSQGQIIQFSQFYSAPTIISPSFTGQNGGNRVVMNYRNQWPGVNNGFTTYGVSYDQYFDKWRSGFGVLMLRDQAGAGDLSLTELGLLYSFNFRMGDWYARPGITFKYAQRGVNSDKFIFGDMIVDENGTYSVVDATTETPITEKVRYPDVASSILFHNDMFWIGGTWDHMLRPNQSMYVAEAQVHYKFSAYGGVKFDLNTRRAKFTEENISVAFHYRNQYKYNQLDLGVYWTKTPLVLGLYFRGMPFLMERATGYKNIDAVIVLLGYKMGNISMGYSYDITINGLMGSSHGSHEISLIYNFDYDVGLKVTRRRTAIPCPSL